MWFKKKHVCEFELTHATKEQMQIYDKRSNLHTGYLCIGKCECGKEEAWLETKNGPKFIVSVNWAALFLNIDPAERV